MIFLSWSVYSSHCLLLLVWIWLLFFLEPSATRRFILLCLALLPEPEAWSEHEHEHESEPATSSWRSFAVTLLLFEAESTCCFIFCWLAVEPEPVTESELEPGPEAEPVTNAPLPLLKFGSTSWPACCLPALGSACRSMANFNRSFPTSSLLVLPDSDSDSFGILFKFSLHSLHYMISGK